MRQYDYKFLILLFILPLLLAGDILNAAEKAGKKKEGPQHYLSAVLLFRDEAPYLKEWIEYHQMLGIEHFYCYNNLSKDNCKEVLAPYISRGLIELIDWDYDHNLNNSFNKVQNDCYRDAIKKSAKETVWLAIIDADEFIVPNKHETITAMLKELEKNDRKNVMGGCFLQWIVFGTSGIDKIPDTQLMIETLTYHEQEVHKFGKSIVKPKQVKDVLHGHRVKFKKHMQYQELPVAAAQINHYMYRDQYYFKSIKLPRIEKRGDNLQQALDEEAGANADNRYSLSIQRFIPELRKRMNLVPLVFQNLVFSKERYTIK